MKERPIPMSAPMVRAIIDGTKTQTRRVITDRNSRGNYRASELLLDDPRTFADPGPSPAGNPGWYLHAPVNTAAIEARRGWKSGDCDPQIVERLYPWVFPGDRLWVREAWRAPASCDHLPPRSISDSEGRRFVADEVAGHDAGYGRFRQGMFMPRWASRIDLRVTGVRVERLQDISEADAAAEGLKPLSEGADRTWTVDADPRSEHETARETYRWLWEQINGDGSWEANLWVWVVEFRRIKP